MHITCLLSGSVRIIIIMCCDSSKGGHVTPSRMMFSTVEYDVYSHALSSILKERWISIKQSFSYSNHIHTFNVTKSGT